MNRNTFNGLNVKFLYFNYIQCITGWNCYWSVRQRPDLYPIIPCPMVFIFHRKSTDPRISDHSISFNQILIICFQTPVLVVISGRPGFSSRSTCDVLKNP
jgi:hypothetical protein